MCYVIHVYTLDPGPLLFERKLVQMLVSSVYRYKICYSLQKSDRKISHPNDFQPAVKDITVNSIYPIAPLTAGWRWFEHLKYCISSIQIFFRVALCYEISNIKKYYSLSGWVLSQML